MRRAIEGVEHNAQCNEIMSPEIKQALKDRIIFAMILELKRDSAELTSNQDDEELPAASQARFAQNVNLIDKENF